VVVPFAKFRGCPQHGQVLRTSIVLWVETFRIPREEGRRSKS